jgi:ubiquinone/menaquinone biosynthesis C-methylase UbiE
MEKNVESVIAFYDSIARDYDTLMTDQDAEIRLRIQSMFGSYLTSGNVLDFGGGTGLDLPGLLSRNYNVFFLEPALNMRHIAKARCSMNNHVVFVEDATDFHDWSKQQLPFAEKMNGVMINFGVLNCIRDLDVLFDKIALITARGSYIFAVVLQADIIHVLRRYSVFSALRLLFLPTLTILNRHNGVYHDTYVHTKKSIVRSAARHFDFRCYHPLESSDFAIVVLQAR